MTAKSYIKTLTEWKEQVKLGRIDKDYYMKIRSVYRSQLTKEAVKELKEMGINC